jgi:hypothetical protein
MIWVAIWVAIGILPHLTCCIEFGRSGSGHWEVWTDKETWILMLIAAVGGPLSVVVVVWGLCREWRNAAELRD